MPDDHDRELVGVPSDLATARRARNDARRAEVLSLTLAGFTHEMIGDRLGISTTEVGSIIHRALQGVGQVSVEEMRQVENARLDRAQAAIWSGVLEGNGKAISTFLQISSRRARLNGLDAPLQIELSASVKIEMQQALAELEEIVLGDVVDAEEVSDVGDSDDPFWPEAEPGGTG